MRNVIRGLGLALAVTALVALAAPAPYVEALSAQSKSAQTETGRPTSDPFTGDPAIFDQPGRDDALHIDRVMDVLQITSGSAVADIGAGGGWFTVRAARRVGELGTVYAVDINKEFLDGIAKRAEGEQLHNVRTVLGAEDDPRLPDRSVDAVLILKAYHEIAKPISLMRHLRDALRPNALVGIIDRNGKGDDHGVDADVVVRELDRAGYALVARHDFVKSERTDYFLVFKLR